MARRRSNRRSRVNRTRQRDLTNPLSIARRRIPTYRKLYRQAMLAALPVADLRTHSPSKTARRAARRDGLPAAVALHSGRRRRRRKLLPFGVGFVDPRRVSVCIRRKVRREVLHATRQTGKGARARRRRRNAYSWLTC